MRKSSRDRKPSAALVYSVQHELQTAELKLLTRPQKRRNQRQKTLKSVDDEDDDVNPTSNLAEKEGNKYECNSSESISSCNQITTVKAIPLCNCCREIKRQQGGACSGCYADAPEKVTVNNGICTPRVVNFAG